VIRYLARGGRPGGTCSAARGGRLPQCELASATSCTHGLSGSAVPSPARARWQLLAIAMTEPTAAPRCCPWPPRRAEQAR
jgi:hypothetical protein